MWLYYKSLTYSSFFVKFQEPKTILKSARITYQNAKKPGISNNFTC